MYEFAAKRGHQLFLPDDAPDYNWYATKIWGHENTKGYHVVFKLCEFLGFDPLFFGELTPEDFKEGKYRRHHFRDDPLRKKSYHLRDIILTNLDNHMTYETYLGHEKFMDAIYTMSKNGYTEED